MNPNNPIFYESKGKFLFTLGKFDLVVKSLDEAIKLADNNLNVHAAKALALVALKKYDLAVESYNKAMELNPNDADLYHDKGITLIKLGDYESAFKVINKSIDLDLTNQGRYDAVIEAYDEAIELDPNNADLYHDKNVILQKLDKNKLSQDFIKAFNLKRDDAVFCVDKALSVAQLCEEDLVGDLVQEATSQNLYAIKACMFSVEGKYDVALEAINKCIESEPENFYSYYNKARVLYSSKQYALALINFNKAIELNPNNAGLYYNKAMVLAQLGNYTSFT